MLSIFIILCKVYRITSLSIDMVDCGVDNDAVVEEGDVDVVQYPWLGVLYYQFWGQHGETRSVTTVALIHREFVIGAAADIGPMPKKNFRRKTRVLLGEDYESPGRRVRNYVLHPEYGETYNSICLVQLKDKVKNPTIRPLCPPPNFLRNPEFYVVRMKFDTPDLGKEVIRVVHIPGKMCKDFYVAANLYSKMMRPPHVACAVEIKTKEVCVWSAGAALVSRDAWGRWQLLGVGVRGPGCGAPSRYLDMMSYYPWIEDSLAKFQEFTISRITPQKYVLRYNAQETSGSIDPDLVGERHFERFGACDEEEKRNLLYREVLSLRTDNRDEQTVKYNLTIFETVEFTCLTLEIINGSTSSEMRVTHECNRWQGGPSCYRHYETKFDIAVLITFGDTCLFEMVAWGHHISMHLIDIHEWKWREGEYYDDFSMSRVEYRGTVEMTGFGFEPLDRKEWVPTYDLWTTTQYVWWDWTTLPPQFLPADSPGSPHYQEKKRKKKPKYKHTTYKEVQPYCLLWFMCWFND